MCELKARCSVKEGQLRLYSISIVPCKDKSCRELMEEIMASGDEALGPKFSFPNFIKEKEL